MTDLADRIERAIDPEHCNYGPAHDSVPGIIVNLKASEWRQVIRALRSPAAVVDRDLMRFSRLFEREAI